MTSASVIASIADAIHASRKYCGIARETVLRVVAAALERREENVLKAAKRTLHQVSGAFITPGDAERIAGLVETMRGGSDLLAACDAVLRLHSSTAERLPYYREFYRGVFAATGTPGSVMDIGCGLAPFSLPYMGLPSRIRYIAIDIDSLLIHRVNDFLLTAGYGPCARVQDVIVSPPADEVDVAFALKLLPVLEQQVKGCSLPILTRLNARRLVVSFPLRSLSGRRKGMPSHYREQYEGMLAGEFRMLEEFELPNELVYIMATGARERC